MKRLLLLFVFNTYFLLLCAQQPDSRGIDTTSHSYQIGRSIGEWIPFLILFTLALLVIIRSYRIGRQDKG